MNYMMSSFQIRASYGEIQPADVGPSQVSASHSAIAAQQMQAQAVQAMQWAALIAAAPAILGAVGGVVKSLTAPGKKGEPSALESIIGAFSSKENKKGE